MQIKHFNKKTSLKFAPNFTQDELIEAINYAHIYDVKIYVTVNTIIYESEINDCLKYCIVS